MFIPDLESNEHAELRAAVRSLLERRSSEPQLRHVIETDDGYDAELWRQMAEQVGLHGLPIAEEFGGAGAGAAELAIVFQEFGRVLVPTPYFSTVALAGTLLQAIGSEFAETHYLPGIAAGEIMATVALSGEDERWDASGVRAGATEANGEWVLTGEWPYVTDGMAAQLLLIPVRTTNGISLFALNPQGEGVTRKSLETLDLTRRQATFVLDHAPATLIGAEGEAQPALEATIRTGILALVAEQTGAAEFLMEMALEYAKVRHQFGRAIGGFQAIKHKLADMAFDLERMKSVLRQLVVSTSTNSSDLDIVTHLAKAYCSEALFRIAADTIQVHGGIGFTWEHRAHLYFRRAKSTEALLGSPYAHREKLLERLEVARAA